MLASNKFEKLAIALLALQLAAFATGASADGPGLPPLDNMLRDEIRTILDGGRGQIRKWIEPPNVVVVYRDEHIPGLVGEAIDGIEIGLNNFIGFGEVTTLDLDDIGDNLIGHLDVNGRGGDIFLTWDVNGSQSFVQGDIFVFSLPLEEMLYLGALTRIKGSFMRGLARGHNPSCFFSVWSQEDVLGFGAVFVRSDYDLEHYRRCIYEELIQSLGLLNDAQGTTVFTLNNELQKKGQKSADRALLDALYEPSIEPGAPTDIVVRHIESQQDQED